MKAKFKKILFEELWSLWQWPWLFIPGRFGHFLRGMLLGLFFKKKGSWLSVKENVEIFHPENLMVGDNCGIGRNNIINCVGEVTFGNDVRLGPNVMVTTVDHTNSRLGMQNLSPSIKPVKIGSNVWIGFGAIILPGAVVGNNCLIGALSVVNKEYPDNSVILGVPGRALNSFSKTNFTCNPLQTE